MKRVGLLLEPPEGLDLTLMVSVNRNDFVQVNQIYQEILSKTSLVQGVNPLWLNFDNLK